MPRPHQIFLTVAGSLLLNFLLSASPLIQAAHDDDLAKVTSLIASGTKVNTPNHYGVTALSLACQNGNLAMVQALLTAGADANSARPGNETVLHTAARTGSLPIVEKLVSLGAKTDAREHHGQTPLMWAAAEGHHEVVAFLIGKKADFQSPLHSGFTPLLFAVRQGHLETTKLLLDHHAKINKPAKPKRSGGKNLRTGTTPLVLAIENGHFDLAAELLDRGADPNDQRSGFAPLHVLSWVRKSVKGDGDDGLPPPARSGKLTSLDIAKLLVKHGADPNLRLEKGRGGTARVDRKGATPFLLAAQTADLPFLKVLVELGADPTLTNRRGTTPLLAAAGMGVTAPGEEAADLPSALEVVKWLVKNGADLNAIDQGGETVMHAAAYKSAPKMMQLLDELGADIAIWNQKNKSGWTPLRITRGYRPGNFRPIETSERALIALMKKHGAEIPPTPN